MAVRTYVKRAVCPEPVAVAERGAYPGKKLGCTERFGNIVVCAQIQRLYLFALSGAGGDNDDRNACPGSDLAYERSSVHIRQAEIQKDDIGTL